jgi:hypothetical protein
VAVRARRRHLAALRLGCETEPSRMIPTSTLVLLGPLLAQEPARPPELLPHAPPGWRRERLDFPLGFAPELSFRGYEDLLFAPGMFEPDSESYFSYALALRLEGDVPVDEASLASFLETYYRGLCRAVGEERGLALDLASVRARVSRDGEQLRARVEAFDPFVPSITGEPLALEVELTCRAAPRATEVLGLVSPLSMDAPIWTELREVGAAWHAARPAPVFLNHLYAVVDDETYAALRASTFLRETFAVGEERETVRPDLTYSGLYVYGQRTYFEFLPVTPAAGLAEGGTGLALGMEAEGGLDALARALTESGVRSQLVPISRRLGDESVPWFRLLGVEMPAAPLTVFVLEYDPLFLTRWHADLPPQSAAPRARSAVLERYAASLGRSPLRSEAPLLDVVEVELRLGEAERERLLAVSAAAGHEVEAAADTWTIHAPELTLVVRPSPADGAGGVSAFTTSLRRPLEHEPLELGQIGVRFDVSRAIFTLRR